MQENYSTTGNLVSLRQFMVLCRKHFLSILIWIVACGGLGFIISSFVIIPKYQAETEVLINAGSSNSDNQQSGDQLVATYKDMVTNANLMTMTSKRLAKPANEEHSYNISPAKLAKSVKVTNSQNSQIITINVTANDPYKAATIANTLTSCLKVQSKKLLHKDNVTVVANAKLPGHSPVYSVPFVTVLGAVIGFVLSLLYVLINAYMHPRVFDAQFMNDQLNMTQLGSFSHMANTEGKDDIY